MFQGYVFIYEMSGHININFLTNFRTPTAIVWLI